MKRVGLVLGAGGVVGQAYHSGVLAALEHDLGWDPRTAEVIVGTSAGSITGTLLRLGVSAEDLTLMIDLRTGVFLTLFIAFLMLACTVGVSQAAAILDERRLLISLDRTGMPRTVFEKAQRAQVWAPLLLAALGGAGAAVALVLPIVGASLLVAPLAMLTMALCFALGFGAVWLALLGTRPVVTSVLASPHRG